MIKKKEPGVSREDRLSDEGLIRLEKQLKSGPRPSELVLKQWVRRYGESAKAVIVKYVPYFKS